MAFFTRLLAAVAATLLTMMAVSAQASDVRYPKDKKDLTILPKYCEGTQIIRGISKLPRASVDAYYASYGPTYNHVHHYCWALFAEFNGDKMLDKGPRVNAYRQALNDIDYVLHKSPPPSFPLLPEIHTSRGRILLKMDKPGEGIAELNNAINLKPDYEPAYMQLSDYYLNTGKKQNAISILEKGVENNPSPSRLLRKLKKLGKPYQGTPGSAVAKHQETDSPSLEPIAGQSAPSGATGTDQTAPSDSGAAASGAGPAQSDSEAAAPPAIGKPGNPYCRFCP